MSVVLQMHCQWPLRCIKSVTTWHFRCGSNGPTFVISWDYFSVGAQVQLVVIVEVLFVSENPEPPCLWCCRCAANGR